MSASSASSFSSEEEDAGAGVASVSLSESSGEDKSSRRSSVCSDEDDQSSDDDDGAIVGAAAGVARPTAVAAGAARAQDVHPGAHGLPQLPMAEEVRVVLDEVLRLYFSTGEARREGDEMFGEACAPWLGHCLSCSPLRVCGVCCCSTPWSKPPSSCCSGADGPAPLLPAESQQARSVRERTADPAGYPGAVFRPLHGCATLVTKRWVKWLVMGLAVLSIPVFLILTFVTGSSVWLGVFAITQFATIVLLLPRTLIACVKLYQQLSWAHLLTSLVSVGASLLFGLLVSLIPSDSWLMWSYLRHLEFDEDDAFAGQETDNLINFAMRSVISATLFVALLLLILPAAAFLEELIFRGMAANWRGGLIRSFVFGAIHFTMGVPLIYVLTVMPLMGAWFQWWYFLGLSRYLETEREMRAVATGEEAEALRRSSGEGTRLVVHCTCSGPAAPWGGHVLPEQQDWKMRPVPDRGWRYIHKPSRKASGQAPVHVHAIAAGLRSSTLVHLGHNLAAVLSILGVYLYNQISGGDVQV